MVGGLGVSIGSGFEATSSFGVGTIGGSGGFGLGMHQQQPDFLSPNTLLSDLPESSDVYKWIFQHNRLSFTREEDAQYIKVWSFQNHFFVPNFFLAPTLLFTLFYYCIEKFHYFYSFFQAKLESQKKILKQNCSYIVYLSDRRKKMENMVKHNKTQAIRIKKAFQDELENVDAVNFPESLEMRTVYSFS